ncbi:MAG: asparaginase [SAR324 cluster bacterium]|nr:asparaginase [SAR324 cluster bacterium]
MAIKIITTGGTIDKIYFDQKSTFQVGEPQIVGLLKEANVTVDYEVKSVLRKDSLDMTDEDRQLIYETILTDSHRKFIVTHGTDTMVVTARRLQELTEKVVVLTGAMQPAKLKVSDAVFNIGFAIASVQLLPSGVYIAMNGCLFTPDRVQKNVEYNRFEVCNN